MRTLERFLLSLILVTLATFCLREGDYQQRQSSVQRGIVVSVSGAVAKPGVVQLPAGARAVHAITLCGGLATGADHAAVPLARPLADGDHLVVPHRALAPQAPPDPPESPLDRPPVSLAAASSLPPPRLDPPPDHRVTEETTAAPARGSKGGSRKSAPPAEPLDLNRATVEELDTLPGIGPVTARRIVEAREKAPGGTFGSLEELGAIRGIKAKTFLRLKPYLKIEGS